MSRIVLEGISKSYGRVEAVRDITLTVGDGEFVTLLGPSGSGKTTTMRMIAGLERPSGGRIALGDTTVNGPGGVFVPPHRRRLGMVFQSYAVWPHKTVFENVRYPLEQQQPRGGDDRARVIRMLEMVGLERYFDRYPSQLSGGQQQRVALARALVAEPDVILFDEPLSNLDAKLRDSMRTLLSELHHSMRITSVFVTHDQVEAMVLSDRICLMNDGLLLQVGTPEELYEHPQTLFAARFIGNANAVGITDFDAQSGTVSLRTGTKLHVAGQATSRTENVLIVRPHQVSLAAESDLDNTVPATVRVVSYLGDRIRYDLALEDSTEIVAEMPATPSRARVGEAVRVKFPAAACRVL